MLASQGVPHGRLSAEAAIYHIAHNMLAKSTLFLVSGQERQRAVERIKTGFERRIREVAEP